MRIFLAGMRRSGSTLLYNIVRMSALLACPNSGLSVHHCGNAHDPLCVDAVSEVLKKPLALVKFHEYNPIFMAPQTSSPSRRNVVITSHRSPRSWLGSLLTWNMFKDWQQQLADYQQWVKNAAVDVAYEELMSDNRTVCARILKAFGWDHISPDLVLAAVEESNKHRHEIDNGGFDAVRGTHAAHITPYSKFAKMTALESCQVLQTLALRAFAAMHAYSLRDWEAAVCNSTALHVT